VISRFRKGVTAPRELVCSVESLEPRRLLAGITVSVPAGGSVVFSAPDGTLCNLHFGGCSGSVTFEGTNLEQSSALNGTIVVKGDTTTVSGIAVNNSTIGSSVVLRAKTPEKIPLGSFTATGPIKMVTLEQMTLEGELDAPGISMLNLGSMQNANVQFAGFTGAQPFSITAGAVTDSTIKSNEPFKSIIFASYTATTPGTPTTTGSSVITAPSIDLFHVTGNSTGDLNLIGGTFAQTLGKAMIGGNVSAGYWNINGNTAFAGANSFGGNWSGFMAGYCWGLRTTTDFSGSLTVGSVNTASIGRNMFDANVHFTYYGLNFKNWNVGNSISASYVYGLGSYGSLKSQFMSGSSFLAGVGSSFNFTGANQFVTPTASFDSINIHCHTKMLTFLDSYVGAPYVGIANLGMVNGSNFGTPFGVRTNKGIKQFKLNFNTKQISITNVQNASTVQLAEAAAGVTTQDAGDFTVFFGG
jgi:hypothetical protein